MSSSTAPGDGDRSVTSRLAVRGGEEQRPVLVVVEEVGKLIGAYRLGALLEHELLLARESTDIAQKALTHSARGVELPESLEEDRKRQQQARAMMNADISPLIYTAQATGGNCRATVTVRNEGARDSGATIIRVYMPAGEDLMAWDDEHNKLHRVRPIVDPRTSGGRSDGAPRRRSTTSSPERCRRRSTSSGRSTMSRPPCRSSCG